MLTIAGGILIAVAALVAIAFFIGNWRIILSGACAVLVIALIALAL